MGFSSSSMDDGQGPSGSTLSEINVTPLVDVMLVLLTIFMVASSVETIQAEQEKDKALRAWSQDGRQQLKEEEISELKERVQEQEDAMSRQRRLISNLELQSARCREREEELEDRSRNVPINLPRVDSDAVNLAEERKMVLVYTLDHKLFVGDTLLVDCLELAGVGAQGGAQLDLQGDSTPPWFFSCLKVLEDKLVANKKLQDDGECYLKADRALPYGRVLALMSTIRRSGISRFGLVSEMLDD